MKNRKIAFSLALALLLGVLLTFTFTASANEETIAPKMSITMADRLVFNIYVPKDDALTEIKVDGKVMDTSSLPEENGHFHISIPLDASDADRDIKLSLALTRNEKTKIGSFTLSVVKYASKLISSNESETVKKLAKDTLAYVNDAKEYFCGARSENIYSILGSYEGVFSPKASENTTAGLKLASFSLKSKPAVRFYLADGYKPSDFEFYQADKKLVATSGTDSYGSYVEISRYAYAMTQTFNYTVVGIEGTYAYNLSSYCDYVRNEYKESDKDLLLALAESFYVYCESAEAYRKEVIMSTCEHAYTSAVKEEATATKAGVMEYVCTKCGHSYNERIPTTLKVLAIGNSFSEDAFKHMYIIAKDMGIENVVLGNMYIGGCSLATHMTNMNGDLGKYKFWLSSDSANGMIVEGENRTAKYGITYTDWDYISIQQASNHSGLESKYGDLQGVIDYINANKTSDAEIIWHMTWAYQQDSTHSGFPSYNSDQMTMYNSILSVVENKILTNDDISFVIPSGTAIQNLRTSTLGDTLTRDGYHLSYGIGRYTAALTWLAKITGCDISKITATPADHPDVAKYLDHIKDAVVKAIANPYEVTVSAYPKTDEPEEEKPVISTTFSELKDSDRAYLTAHGFDPDKYVILDLTVYENLFYNSTDATDYAGQKVQSTSSNQYMKWWSTQILSKAELVNGSVIRLDAGGKYRPEGWIDMKKNTTRPDTVTANSDYCITVNDEWWGSYNYRAFNIGKSNGGTFTQAEYDKITSDADNRPFKIYVPKKTNGLTADDRAYLVAHGFDPDKYEVLALTVYENLFYNSTLANNYATQEVQSTGSAQYMKWWSTQIFSKTDLVTGSIIRLDAGSKYRPEGWIDMQKNSSRPNTVTANTDYCITVTDEWWGSYNYRAFNIGKASNTTYTQAEYDTILSDPDSRSFKIYVPKQTNGLTDDDRAYLTSLGLDPDDYKVLELDFTDNAYYNSTTDFHMHRESASGSKYQLFLATKIFSRNDLTVGSVIRLSSGYKYRPDGWVDLSTVTAKDKRPANVTAETVIVDDAWWGSFNYRAFNLCKSSGAKISLAESVNLRIYVKVK